MTIYAQLNPGTVVDERVNLTQFWKFRHVRKAVEDIYNPSMMVMNPACPWIVIEEGLFVWMKDFNSVRFLREVDRRSGERNSINDYLLKCLQKKEKLCKCTGVFYLILICVRGAPSVYRTPSQFADDGQYCIWVLLSSPKWHIGSCKTIQTLTFSASSAHVGMVNENIHFCK